jgi:catechol 2,3-dioxygenase-like lactoylglutathione lyase family enzyme
MSRLDIPNPWVELDAGTVVLGLEEVKKRGRSYKPPWGGAIVSFLVEDIVQARADLEKKGINFNGDIFIFDKVKITQFKDPDGNLLELHQRL